MNSVIARGYRIALASFALAGLYCGAAGAAGVGAHNAQDMDHWYGRAGGPAPSDSINASDSSNDPGQSIGVGVPANSGSLLYDEAGGGIRSKPNMRTNEGSVQIGLPANSGSLLYDEAGGGIRSKANMRSSGQEQAQQPTASLQQGTSSNQH